MPQKILPKRKEEQVRFGFRYIAIPLVALLVYFLLQNFMFPAVSPTVQEGEEGRESQRRQDPTQRSQLQEEERKSSVSTGRELRIFQQLRIVDRDHFVWRWGGGEGRRYSFEQMGDFDKDFQGKMEVGLKRGIRELVVELVVEDQNSFHLSKVLRDFLRERGFQPEGAPKVEGGKVLPQRFVWRREGKDF